MNIKFSPPDISKTEIQNVVEVLKSGWLTTGPRTKEFELKIAKYCNTERAVCLNSATAALEMTLRLLGIGEGDEVITSAYTYTASASVIYHTGAKIILVDTAKDSYEMDYHKLEAVITENTKAIITVDIGGVMCDYDKVFKIVNNKKKMFSPKNKIQSAIGRMVVIADGAHSFGAKYKEKMSGEVADFTSFSFHAVKNLTTAEGGAVTWKTIMGVNNEEIYRQYMILSLHGQTKDAMTKEQSGDWQYDIELPGYKCNMTDIMAAIGLAQLERYDELLQYRKLIIEKYNESLLKEKNLHVFNHQTAHSISNGHLYLVRIKNATEEIRDEIIKKMANFGVPTNVHFKPLPLLTAYKKIGFDIKDFPNAFDMYKNEITLPLHSLLSSQEVEYIIMKFKEIIKEYENI